MYTPGIIRFGLTHYLDIKNGNSVIEEGLFRSNGKGNPNESALTLLADIDRAISSLCKSYNKDLWPEISRLNTEMMRARSEYMPPSQRYIVKNCIFGDCGRKCQRSKSESQRYICLESGSIYRMINFLNGEKPRELVKSIPEVKQAKKRWKKWRNLKPFADVCNATKTENA